MTIQRGQKSIGLSNSIPLPATLPPAADDTQTIINALMDKLSNLETIVEGKADADRIRTLIAYSDEAVLIKARDIVLAGEVTFANLVNEWNGTTSGEVPQSITRIVGDRIQTGTITSNNWGAAEGSAYDLNNGTITIGGSDNPSLVFDGTDLFLSGNITAASFVLGKDRTLGDMADAIDGSMDEAELNSILAAGVGNIIAGEGGDFILDVGESQIFAKHKDFNELGTAAYTGTLRTGLLVTANGVAMGYNQKSDGAFVPAVAIDSTGDISIQGTIIANSVIANTVTVDGQQIGAIKSNAATGSSHAGSSGNPHNASLSQINGDLDQISDGSTYFRTTSAEKSGGSRAFSALNTSSNYRRSISTQNITVSGANPTNGVVIDSSGLRGYGGGALKFEINATTGEATFSGNVETSGRILGRGSSTYAGHNAGVLGYADNATIGVLGYTNTSTWTGVKGIAAASNAWAMEATATNSGNGLYVYVGAGRPAVDVRRGNVIIYDNLSVGLNSSLNTVTVGGATASAGRPALYLNQESAPGAQSGQIAVYGAGLSTGQSAFGLITQRSVVNSGTFSPDRALRVMINGAEYDLALRAV